MHGGSKRTNCLCQYSKVSFNSEHLIVCGLVRSVLGQLANLQEQMLLDNHFAIFQINEDVPLDTFV